MDANALAVNMACPVCLAVFTQPKVLPCGHCFCAPCVGQLNQTNAPHIRCPVCQAVSAVPAGGLPTNFALLALIDPFASLSAEAKFKCLKCASSLPPCKLYVCAADDCYYHTFCGDCAIDAHKTHPLTKLTAAIEQYNEDKAAWKDKMQVQTRALELVDDDGEEVALCKRMMQRLLRQCGETVARHSVRRGFVRRRSQPILAKVNGVLATDPTAKGDGAFRPFEEPLTDEERAKLNTLDERAKQYTEELGELIHHVATFEDYLATHPLPPPAKRVCIDID